MCFILHRMFFALIHVLCNDIFGLWGGLYTQRLHSTFVGVVAKRLHSHSWGPALLTERDAFFFVRRAIRAPFASSGAYRQRQ